MSLGELVDKVMALLGCDAADAFKVAQTLYSPEREDYSDDVIAYAGANLGVKAEAGEEPAPPDAPLAEITMDPAEVLRQVYLMCPRLVPADEDGKVHMPVIGRAPQEEAHAIDPAFLEQLPEEIRVLLMELDVMNGTANVVLYDEANGVDRRLPPIDLTRFTSSEALHEALGVMLKRLPKYLAADWN